MQKLKHIIPSTVQHIPAIINILGPKISKHGPTQTPTIHTIKAYIEKIHPMEVEEEDVSIVLEIMTENTPVVL